MYETESSRWRAVQCRDQNATSAFVYAVISTKIYCRPCCPARLARRANVCFYDTKEEAVAAGYRACLRCKPDQDAGDYDSERSQRDAVRRACEYIKTMKGEPKFADVAKHVGLSVRYLYGLFKSNMGTTPAKYAARFKSDTGTPQSSKTLSPSSDIVSTVFDEPMDAFLDVSAWGTILDLDFTDYAAIPKVSELPSGYGSIDLQYSMPLQLPNESIIANDTAGLVLPENFDIPLPYLNQLDPNCWLESRPTMSQQHGVSVGLDHNNQLSHEAEGDESHD